MATRRRAPREELGTLRLRLTQAGFRREEALTIFFGIRIVFLAVGLFLLLSTPIIIRPNLLAAMAGVFGGYLMPGIVLARLAKRRQHRIRLSLADALDLLVVSVEAGLGLDQALMRVAAELEFAYPELAGELKLINLELRAGKPRSEALRNLAERTGVDDLTSLVTMLIQTDKFGTSVAQSLRVFSDTLRTKRRQRAEEAAAKTGVKMVFPLVFCIFPAIWVVTIGPAAIKFITRPDADDRRRSMTPKGLVDRRTAHGPSCSRATTETGRLLANRVALAVTRSARRKGLLGKDSLGRGEALWIAPCRGVHTCGMRFAIDVVALDGDGRVIDRVDDDAALAAPAAAMGRGRRARAGRRHAGRRRYPDRARDHASSIRWSAGWD